MDERLANNTTCLQVRGIILLRDNLNPLYAGVLKRGVRLLLWGDYPTSATSISFIHDIEIQIGESRNCEIVILSPQSTRTVLKENDTYSVGTPGRVIGELTILSFVGKWEGKVP